MHRSVFVTGIFMWFNATVAAQVTGEQAEQLRQAHRQLRSGQTQRAAETLHALTEEHPTLAEAHRLLGHAYLGSGQVDRAREAFVQSIAHGRLTSDALAALARIDRQAGREMAAAASLQWRLLFEPTESRYAVLLAQTLADAGALHSARAVARNAVEADPDSLDALRVLGNIELQAGDPSAALIPLSAAHWLGRKDPELVRTIAELHYQTGAVGQSIAWYRRALDGRRESAPGSLRLAEMLIAGERYSEARRLLQKLTRSGELDQAEVHRLLGHAEHELGQRESALAAWRKAAELGWRDVEVLSSLVSHALETGDMEALRHDLPLLESQDRMPRSTVHVVVRGNLRLDRPEAATRAIRRYVEHAGLDRQARELLARVASSAVDSGR